MTASLEERLALRPPRRGRRAVPDDHDRRARAPARRCAGEQRSGRTLSLMAAGIAVVAVGAIVAIVERLAPTAGRRRDSEPVVDGAPRRQRGPSERRPPLRRIHRRRARPSTRPRCGRHRHPARVLVRRSRVYVGTQARSAWATELGRHRQLRPTRTRSTSPSMVASPGTAPCELSLRSRPPRSRSRQTLCRSVSSTGPPAVGTRLSRCRPTSTASFEPPPAGSWVVRILAASRRPVARRGRQAFFNVDVVDATRRPSPPSARLRPCPMTWRGRPGCTSRRPVPLRAVRLRRLGHDETRASGRPASTASTSHTSPTTASPASASTGSRTRSPMPSVRRPWSTPDPATGSAAPGWTIDTVRSSTGRFRGAAWA